MDDLNKLEIVKDIGTIDKTKFTFYTYQKAQNLLQSDFDLLKDSLEKLEQSVEPSYISNLKENIDSFLEKLNTKKYGFTTTEN
jgi:hypothetical protein